MVRFFRFMLWASIAVSGMGLARGNGTDTGQTGPSPAITAQASKLFGDQGPAAMAIDIEPDSQGNIVRLGSKLVIPVAIFGSGELAVIDINPRTIRLNGVDIMLVGKSDKSLCRWTDINGDSYQDLVCDVRTTGFKIAEGDYAIIIRAATYSGESLLGKDQIRFRRK